VKGTSSQKDFERVKVMVILREIVTVKVKVTVKQRGFGKEKS
jgi:hypothetical protein